MARPELSLIIPIYNEEEVLPQLEARVRELLEALAIDTEVVFVNDGSRDKSMELLRRMASHEPRYRVLSFSRNFGHQRAITAGMDKARGRAVVIMDADLQDPPEVVLEMVKKWRDGFDVVYGRRMNREGETRFKLLSAKIFYRVFAAMIPIEVPLDTGDFRLMSRRVVMTMRGLGETHRFVRGLVAWVGFKQTAVEYNRAARAGGETKYPLRKMLAFAIDGIASFSILPLRLATYAGVLVGIASVLCAIAAIIFKYAGLTVPGWTTTVVLVSFLFSAQFFMIGVLGEYVGRIYEQVKARPLYVVSERVNFGGRSRKTGKLVTGDIEVVPLSPLPLVASRAALPPPPATVVAAGAAAEAAIAGAANGPSPSSRLPPAKPPTRPPPIATGESKPGLKLSAGVARVLSSPPRPRAPSIPPPLPDARTTSSVAPTRAPSIPPPLPDARTTSSVAPTRAPNIPPPLPEDRRVLTPRAPATTPPRSAPSATAAKPKAAPPGVMRDAKTLFGSKANDAESKRDTRDTRDTTEAAATEPTKDDRPTSASKNDENHATSKETPSQDGASTGVAGERDAAASASAGPTTAEKDTPPDEGHGGKDDASSAG